MERALSCGDPTGRFAWLACPDGHHHRLVPFSCQTRGFCPSCGGRRMADRALRWTEELLPRVAVRQLVLTVPWLRRLRLARRPELARGVLRCALAEVTRWLRREGVRRGAGGEPGTAPVMQRFGSALHLNLHFHVLLLDGLYVADASGVPRFRRARRWRQSDVDALIVRIAARCEAWLTRRGFVTDQRHTEAPPARSGDLDLTGGHHHGRPQDHERRGGAPTARRGDPSRHRPRRLRATAGD
jgi:hypothetical protein